MTGYVYGDRKLRLEINGEYLSVLRRKQMLTQAELARAAGVSRATVERIEQTADNGTAVTRRVWRGLCKALKLPKGQERSILVYEEYSEYDSSDGHHKDPVEIDEEYRRYMAEEDAWK